MNSHNLPLVSIGIPTYNRPDGLRKALDSVVNQTYLNLEIIVSDNCSTNPEVSKVLVEFMNYSRVKIIHQTSNIGPSNNFKFLLENATGQYFKYLADDDWIDLNYIETCVQFLEENQDFGIAYGIGQLFAVNGTFLKFDPIMDLNQNNPIDRVKYYYKNVLHNSPFYGLFRKDFAVNYFSFEDEIAIDWVIVARFAFLHKCKLIENTNSYISVGGVSSNIELMSELLNFKNFGKTFPLTQRSLNVFKDFWISSHVYGQLGLIKKLNLSLACFFITINKDAAVEEIKRGIKKIIKRKIVRI